MCINPLFLSGHFIAACLFLFTSPCFHLPHSFVVRNSKLFAHTIAGPFAYESSQVATRKGEREKSEAQRRIPNFIHPLVYTCDFVAHILYLFSLWLLGLLSTLNIFSDIFFCFCFFLAVFFSSSFFIFLLVSCCLLQLVLKPCVVFYQRFPRGRVNTVAVLSSCNKHTIDFPGETRQEIGGGFEQSVPKHSLWEATVAVGLQWTAVPINQS